MAGQLGVAGYSEADIAEGVAVVYGGAPVPVAQTKYAGFWIRWAANFIDGLVLIIPQFIVGFIVGVVTTGLASEVLMRLASFAITWAYFIFMTNKYQATLGKKVVGIRVISDKSENLTLGQIVLRETIGKLISAFILLIGYLMVAFTARKQGLHDMMAGTLVVHNDANKKTPVWIFIVALALPAIAILGILASVVLVSLSSARNKASDMAVKATISSAIPDALVYLDAKGTLNGYSPKLPTGALKPCNGVPIVNISKDGQDIAIFVNSCTDSGKYLCDDLNAEVVEVDQAYAVSGKAVCGIGK